MSGNRAREHDAQLLAGIGVALREARTLGYEVERMEITASIIGDTCSVRFEPIAALGTIVTGHDVSLSIDRRTQQVVQVRRGQ